MPLAVIKVRRRDCRVISVCNWHPLRKHVLTFPTLSYWFGFIPIARMLRQAMHTVCCEQFGLRNFFDRFQPDEPQTDVVQPGGPVNRSAAAGTSAPASAFSMQNAIAIDPLAGFGFATGLFEAVAARQASDEGTPTWADLAKAAFARETVAVDPNLQGKEREAALQRIGATGPLGVLAGAFASFETPLALAAGALGGGSAAGGSVLRGQEAREPDSEIAELRQAIAEQSREIAKLKATVTRSGRKER